MQRQANQERVQLVGCERYRCPSRRPTELALTETTHALPQVEAVVDQHLQVRRATIREEVGMMRPRFAEHAHDARQRRVRPGAHVERLDGHPGRVDSNYRNSSRSHPAHEFAAEMGQAILTAQAPRRSSMRMSSVDATTGGDAICIGANSASSILLRCVPEQPAAARRQRCTRFALMPCASATLAAEAPGRAQAASTFALKAAESCRREREGESCMVSTCGLGGHYRQAARRSPVDDFTGRLSLRLCFAG